MKFYKLRENDTSEDNAKKLCNLLTSKKEEIEKELYTKGIKAVEKALKNSYSNYGIGEGSILDIYLDDISRSNYDKGRVQLVIPVVFLGPVDNETFMFMGEVNIASKALKPVLDDSIKRFYPKADFKCNSWVRDTSNNENKDNPRAIAYLNYWMDMSKYEHVTIINEGVNNMTNNYRIREMARTPESINLTKIGCVRHPEDDFSDDGNRFQVYYYDPYRKGDKRIEVTKLVDRGDYYISARCYNDINGAGWYQEDLNGVSYAEAVKYLPKFEADLKKKYDMLEKGELEDKDKLVQYFDGIVKKDIISNIKEDLTALGAEDVDIQMRQSYCDQVSKYGGYYKETQWEYSPRFDIKMSNDIDIADLEDIVSEDAMMVLSKYFRELRISKISKSHTGGCYSVYITCEDLRRDITRYI